MESFTGLWRRTGRNSVLVNQYKLSVFTYLLSHLISILFRLYWHTLSHKCYLEKYVKILFYQSLDDNTFAFIKIGLIHWSTLSITWFLHICLWKKNFLIKEFIFI